MNLKPTLLFQVSVQHPYYTNASGLEDLQFFPPLDIHLSPAKFAKKDDTLQLYGANLEAGAITSALLVPIESSSPYFYNFTALDPSLTPHTHPNIVPADSSVMKVLWLDSINAMVGEIEAFQENLFPLQASRFTVDLTKGTPPQAITSVKVISNTGKVKTIVPPATPMCQIDLSDQPNGRYNLEVTWADGTEQSYAFISLSKPLRKLPLALLYLRPGALIDGYPDHVSGFKEAKFKLRFKVREAVWRYHLINLAEADFKATTIEAKGEDAPDVDFLRELSAGALPDGTPTHVFYSDEPLPLMENPNYRLRLQLPAEAGSAFDLPFPNPQQVRFAPAKPHETEERSSIVDIYVYL